MKKLILGVTVVLLGLSLYAQEPMVVRVQTTTTNPAYTVPDPIRVRFETSYPDAIWVTWEPTGGWWRATYKGDNKLNQVYYNTIVYFENDPAVYYTVALPVIQSFVPDEVAKAAVEKYGSRLYSITRAKSFDNTDVYQVRLLEKGVMQNTWMNATGTVLTDADVYKVKITDDKMKVKTDEQ
jgi:hypothetical protein